MGGIPSRLNFPRMLLSLVMDRFSFEDLNQNTWLVISVGGEGLGLLGWNSCVSLDESCHDTSGSFKTKRKWGDIEQQQFRKLLGLVGAAQDCGLDSGSEGDGFIRIDRFAQFFSVEEFRKHGLNLGDSGGSSNKDDLINSGL